MCALEASDSSIKCLTPFLFCSRSCRPHITCLPARDLAGEATVRWERCPVGTYEAPKPLSRWRCWLPVGSVVRSCGVRRAQFAYSYLCRLVTELCSSCASARTASSRPVKYPAVRMRVRVRTCLPCCCRVYLVCISSAVPWLSAVCPTADAAAAPLPFRARQVGFLPFTFVSYLHAAHDVPRSAVCISLLPCRN
jgi:hypothetical protein